MSETITVTGNVATEPQQREIGPDAAVTSFRVACTHRRFDRRSNSWIDAYTNFYTVSAFRSLGRNALTSLRVGDRVVVSGTLRLKEWDTGTKRGTTAEIDAESIGHDLRWGTTRFHRTGTPVAAVEQTGEEGSGESGPFGPRAHQATEADIVSAEDEGTDEGAGWAAPPMAVGDRPF